MNNVYFGYEFEQILLSSESSEENKQQLKQRCLKFLQVLLKQLQQRIPKNIDVLEKVSLISIKNALQCINDPLTPLAELLLLDGSTIDKINVQWANLNSVKWIEKSNTISFLGEVFNYTDASGLNPFTELFSLAIRLLVLPWSNAEVERLFSQMNIVKTKLRNRMGPKLLDSILTVRAGLKRSKVCCSEYQLPSEVLKQIGTSVYYDKNVKDTCSTSNEGNMGTIEANNEDNNADDVGLLLNTQFDF